MASDARMKKKVTALLIGFLFLSFSGVILFNSAEANPAPLFSFPTEAIMTSPTILVTSPVQNQTYDAPSLDLTLTIIKPETWFAFNVGSHMDYTPISQTFVNITSIYYKI